MDIIEEEKEYLNYSEKCIEEEIHYSEQELIEIPKRHTKALQGDSFLVESLMSAVSTKLEKLTKSKDSPYFGRFDFYDIAKDKKYKIYVGKTNISHNNNQVVLDWRAPICSLYYDSNIGEAVYESPSGFVNGNVILKRQLVIKDGMLLSAVDTELVNDDELLQPYLEENTDNKMKTIIASIQREQNRIIREPLYNNIIVQGVAGSGKTSVALHRVAYLLYNIEDSGNSKKVLSLGPNKYFLDYVSSVLPDLDIESINQMTYVDLINMLFQEKYRLYNQDKALEDAIKNENLMKVAQFKSSLEYKKALDRFIADYLSNRFVTHGIIIDGEDIFNISDIKRLLFKKGDNKPNFESACKSVIDWFNNNYDDIYDQLNQKYRNIYINLPRGNVEREEAVKKSTELAKYLKTNGVKAIRSYFKSLNVSTIRVYNDFIKNVDYYTDSLTEDEIKLFKDYSMSIINKGKVSFEDFPALAYINLRLKGINNDFDYIVIDEAQDYGPFHFWILREMFPKSIFSIYGDLAQAIYSYRGLTDWNQVSEEVFDGDIKLLNLNRSYRTTIETTILSNNILRQIGLTESIPVIRHGPPISFSDNFNDFDYKLAKLCEWTDKGYKQIAIICKTEEEAKKEAKLLKSEGIDVKLVTDKTEKYEGNLFVLTAAQSKGLEFDAVIVNNVSERVYNSNSLLDMHLLYVACTRALHEQEILFDKKICDVFYEPLKNSSLLEVNKKEFDLKTYSK